MDFAVFDLTEFDFAEFDLCAVTFAGAGFVTVLAAGILDGGRLMGSTMLMFDVGGSQQRCHLTAGATYYFNVRMSYPAGSIVELLGRAYF